MSFLSPTLGWALSGSTACRFCASVESTRDGGTSWHRRATLHLRMTSGLEWRLGDADVNFVDARHGYVSDPVCASDCVQMTSDGGHTWTVLPLPATFQLVRVGGDVVALSRIRGGSWQLESSRVGSSRWTRRPLPRSKADRLELAASGGALAVLGIGSVEGGGAARPGGLGALWTSRDTGRTWSAVINPCRRSDGGATSVTIALGHPFAMLLLCWDGRQSEQATFTKNHLYGTVDGGRTWNRLADPATSGYPQLLADNGAGHAFVAESTAADELRGTVDGARTWHAKIVIRDGEQGWNDLHFVSADTGFVLANVGAPPQHLYRTTDAGLNWSTVPLPSRGR